MTFFFFFFRWEYVWWTLLGASKSKGSSWLVVSQPHGHCLQTPHAALPGTIATNACAALCLVRLIAAVVAPALHKAVGAAELPPQLSGSTGQEGDGGVQDICCPSLLCVAWRRTAHPRKGTQHLPGLATALCPPGGRNPLSYGQACLGIFYMGNMALKYHSYGFLNSFFTALHVTESESGDLFL